MTTDTDGVFVRLLARERQRIGQLERSLDDMAAEVERSQGELVGLPASPPVAEVTPSAAPNVDPKLVHGLRVLVVDDQPVNRTLAEALLRDLGCEVVIPANGEEAVAKVQATAPDLVLMDCHMPGVSGIEAARAIRKAGQRQPIVTVSADVSAENLAQVPASGMQRVLGKPLRRPITCRRWPRPSGAHPRRRSWSRHRRRRTDQRRVR